MKTSGMYLREKVLTLKNKVFYLIVIVLFLAAAAGIRAQGTSSPDRGAKVGNAYAVGDFETINTTNGNLTIRFSLGSLPAGRGSAAAGMYLTYNSKLFNMRSEHRPDHRSSDAYYNRTVIEPDMQKGGWRLGIDYRLEFETRFGDYEPPCTWAPSELNDQIMYSKKLFVVFPDGSRHEMIPSGFKDKLGDRYFNIAMDGMIRSCQGQPTYTNRPDYYSRDGSFLRLESTSQSSWTLYFPDGSKVENGTRIYDRNGNYVDAGSGLTDQFGRTVTVDWDTNGDQLISSKGFDGEDLVWRIRWKQIAVNKTYRACLGNPDCPGDDFPLENYRDVLHAGFQVVDKIFQPEQLGGGVYTFSYNGSPVNPFPTTETYGWGELSGVELPSGAKTTYEYEMDGEDGPIMFESTGDILKNYVTTKTLTYDLEYDGQTVPDGAVETWSYSINSDGSSVTAPDGGISQTVFGTTEPDGSGILPWNTGLTLATISPDGTKVENIWERNIPTDCTQSSVCAYYNHQDNPYIKTTFTSLKDASGNYTLTAIKDLTYDKNENVTEVREYDFVPYSSVPRTNGHPTGLPTNAANYLKRTTKSEFYNPAPEASSTNYSDENIYLFSVGTKLLNLAKAVETRDAGNNPKTRQEMYYDHTAYETNTLAGNLTETKVWDSFKGGSSQAYSNPLTTANSVSTSIQYNSYGMPILTTDPKENKTQIVYGTITTPTGTVNDLYPTQTTTAYETTIAQTATAEYDFYTGLVKSSTTLGNTSSENVTNAIEYDALGRPIKTKSAVGTASEIWSQTEYDDVNRRIIARSDLFVKGDGKKIAVQHFDQLGRVRLSRSIENVLTENPYNEVDGIKVQTRYQTGNPNSYQWTSNPYRAAISSAATNEPSMGWTRSMAVNTGKHSEVETFSGAAFPGTATGSTASTGKVQTDIDAERTLVTDQAGKQRITQTNTLGQLINVWEVTAADSNTEAITFGSSSLNAYKTSYSYDTLNNLTTVNQGAQTRSFSYSSLSRLLSATNPESGMITYGYDNNGNLTIKTDAREIETTYTYDALNRVTYREYSDSTPQVTYTYDDKTNAKGKLTKVTTGNPSSPLYVTEYQVFDTMGRVTQSQQWVDGVSYGDPMTYTYNLSGALIEQKYPSTRIVKNVLDNNGDLAIVQSKKNSNYGYWNYANSFTYTAAGAVTSMQLGNGRWESTVFNSRLQPTQIALGTVQNGTDKLNLNFTYNTSGQNDNNGNVLSQTIIVPTETRGTTTHNGFTAVQTYTYDSLNRIKQATETVSGQSGNNWQQTYLYDRYGNRQFEEANTTTLPKACLDANSQPAVCSSDNPHVQTSDNKFSTTDGFYYDDAGNTIRNPQNRKFTYDGENKQVRVDTVDQFDNVTGTLGYYYYDGDGKRVKKKAWIDNQWEETIFVYDVSGKLVAEYSTQVASQQDAKVSYLTTDHLGSPRINTDTNGTVTARHDYQPFGEEITRASYGADGVRKQFTGYEKDEETDLDFAQARYFNSGIGRFSSPDDFLNDTSIYDSQSWNLYVYVRNNPLIYTDESGEEVNGNKLDEKQRQAIIDDYKKKTGFNSVRFDENGLLTVDDPNDFKGGSATAREDLLNAINSQQFIFNLTAATEGERDGVEFADVSSPSVIERNGQFAAEYNVRIDFQDFKEAEGREEVLQAQSIGLVLNHEFNHKVRTDDRNGEIERGEKDSNVGGNKSPGPLEDRNNRARRELGLPTRNVYNYTRKTVTFLTPQGEKKVDYKYQYYTDPNGKKKFIRWKANNK